MIAMGSWFVFEENSWRGSCNILDDSQPIGKADIVACVNGEIMDPFIWLLYPLGIVFFICGWIESAAEKKKR